MLPNESIKLKQNQNVAIEPKSKFFYLKKVKDIK